MRFQKFFPSKSYTLLTELSEFEVKRRINAKINSQEKTSQADFNDPVKRQYKGEVYEHGFRISQVLVGKRNSFAPLITGNISSFNTTTKIEIDMRLSPFVIGFMLFWLGFVGLFCLGMILVGMARFHEILKNGFSMDALIPFGMFIFGCILPRVGFKTESDNSKVFLASLLKAHEG